VGAVRIGVCTHMGARLVFEVGSGMVLGFWLGSSETCVVQRFKFSVANSSVAHIHVIVTPRSVSSRSANVSGYSQ
jgi:hypothetical protein